MKKSLQAGTDKGNIPSEDLERFTELTGLSDVDFTSLLGATGWAVDDALKNVDSCIMRFPFVASVVLQTVQSKETRQFVADFFLRQP